MCQVLVKAVEIQGLVPSRQDLYPDGVYIQWVETDREQGNKVYKNIVS